MTVRTLVWLAALCICASARVEKPPPKRIYAGEALPVAKDIDANNADHFKKLSYVAFGSFGVVFNADDTTRKCGKAPCKVALKFFYKDMLGAVSPRIPNAAPYKFRFLTYAAASVVDKQEMRADTKNLELLAVPAAASDTRGSQFFPLLVNKFLSSADTYMVIAMDFAGDYSLEDVAKRNDVDVTYDQFKQILEQILLALDYLANGVSSGRYIHHDFKGANVRVSFDGSTGVPHVKLVDFGGMEKCTASYQRAHTVCTEPYAPPEWRDNNYAHADPVTADCSSFDMYSLGRVILHFFTDVSKLPNTVPSSTFKNALFNGRSDWYMYRRRSSWEAQFEKDKGLELVSKLIRPASLRWTPSMALFSPFLKSEASVLRVFRALPIVTANPHGKATIHVDLTSEFFKRLLDHEPKLLILPLQLRLQCGSEQKDVYVTSDGPATTQIDCESPQLVKVTEGAVVPVSRFEKPKKQPQPKPYVPVVQPPVAKKPKKKEVVVVEEEEVVSPAIDWKKGVYLEVVFPTVGKDNRMFLSLGSSNDDLALAAEPTEFSLLPLKDKRGHPVLPHAVFLVAQRTDAMRLVGGDDATEDAHVAFDAGFVGAQDYFAAERVIDWPRDFPDLYSLVSPITKSLQELAAVLPERLGLAQDTENPAYVLLSEGLKTMVEELLFPRRIFSRGVADPALFTEMLVDDTIGSFLHAADSQFSSEKYADPYAVWKKEFTANLPRLRVVLPELAKKLASIYYDPLTPDDTVVLYTDALVRNHRLYLAPSTSRPTQRVRFSRTHRDEPNEGLMHFKIHNV